MKRALIFACLFCLPGHVFGQVRMYVTERGTRIGQAVASQKLLPDGGKVVQLSMNLAGPNGKTVTVRMETSYNSKGAPVRKFEETLATSPRYRRTVTVTFDKSGAHVVEEVDGNRSRKDVPLVASAPIESKSEFWFIRDKPKVGAVDKYYHFDLSKLEWRLVTTTYGGLKTIKLGSKQVQGHELKHSEGLAYVDSKGLPYKLDLGTVKLERVPEP